MSKFFGNSDSESESEASEPEVIVPRPQVTRSAYQFSDDEEEGKRVVRSAKDKHFDELRNIIGVIKNHKKIKDMPNVLSDFEDFTKAYDKAKKVVEKEGIPGFYIKTLVELEDFINECWEDRDARKQMSKHNAKGLTTLRQKLRKYIRDFEEEMTKCRENPDSYDKEEEKKVADDDSEDDSADDDFGPAEPKIKTPKSIPMMGDSDDDDDDDDYWPDSSSSEEDEEEDTSRTLTAAYFLKKAGADDEGTTKKEKKDKDKEKKEKSKKRKEDEWKEVRGGAPMQSEKPRMFNKDQEITHEAVLKKLAEIISARGKKGTDRSDQIEILRELLDISNANNLGKAMALKIYFNMIAAIFDYNSNIAACMKPENFTKSLGVINEILELLIENQNITVGELIAEDSESFENEPFRVRGCIITTVERMNKEFTKILQACDAHSTEYVERLADEPRVCEVIKTLQAYLHDSERATSDDLCRVYLRRIEHIYYKFDPQCVSGVPVKEDAETSMTIMDKLCKFIYVKDNTDRLRTWSILYHIYHFAIHDHWYMARDVMLMSHLQDDIARSDVPTQIMYNRTMVQLGLCAFRQGMVRDAHNCLVDIQSSNRAKELLAQGLLLQRQHERTPEQEKIEKRRLLPYHMHINLELLECVYLVSAMLMEIPYMAAHEMDARKRMISKNFHHVLRMSDRQTLIGPPESMREHVVAASKSMKTGDWRACKNFIINEKMNLKVWDLFYSADKVRDMITQKIQEESLRTYLFTYSSVYDSLSLDLLSEMFDLEKHVVHSIISKMIINEELMASLDEPTQTVAMHRTEPTCMQSLALQLAEKVSTLVENNERLMDIKQGNIFFQRKDGNYQNQNQQSWGGRSNYNKNSYNDRSNYNKNTGNRQNYDNYNKNTGNRQNYDKDKKQYDGRRPQRLGLGPQRSGPRY